MINLEELQKMPLPKLLVYREALEALVGKYEQDVLPLYGMASQFDRQTPQQKEGNQKLNRIKGYLNIVYQKIIVMGIDIVSRCKAERAQSDKHMHLPNTMQR